MTESTRIGYVGNSSLEVHLKKNLEVTREMVNDIATLPTDAPWIVAVYDSSTGSWSFEQSFQTFVDADDRFVTLCGNNGLNADRLSAGVPNGKSNSREVRP